MHSRDPNVSIMMPILYLDILNAFDALNHYTIFKVLETYGISAADMTIFSPSLPRGRPSRFAPRAPGPPISAKGGGSWRETGEGRVQEGKASRSAPGEEGQQAWWVFDRAAILYSLVRAYTELNAARRCFRSNTALC